MLKLLQRKLLSTNFEKNEFKGKKRYKLYRFFPLKGLILYILGILKIGLRHFIAPRVFDN